jgi:hypothetical protein
MSKFWCVNFDGKTCLSCGKPKDFVLQHGLKEQLWLMQYQYSHQSKITTTNNWRAADKPKPGDWLVAYLSEKTFYAVGEVIDRRKRERHHNQPVQQDTIERTTKEHRHAYLNGIVEYKDARAMYEDFTDPWIFPSGTPKNEVWKYSQRIDVVEWKDVVINGVQVEGIINKDNFPMCLRAVFDIREDDFKKVQNALQKHLSR